MIVLDLYSYSLLYGAILEETRGGRANPVRSYECAVY